MTMTSLSLTAFVTLLFTGIAMYAGRILGSKTKKYNSKQRLQLSFCVGGVLGVGLICVIYIISKYLGE